MNSARLVPAISTAFDWESSPCEYHRSAAATRISLTNSVGDRRSADSAPSGTSNVIVGIGLASPASGHRVGYWEKTVGVCTLKRGREAPREVLPIVTTCRPTFEIWLWGHATSGTCSYGAGPRKQNPNCQRRTSATTPVRILLATSASIEGLAFGLFRKTTRFACRMSGVVASAKARQNSATRWSMSP